ncbi:hypothetical protein EVAR_88900_1 [Eumeta japonica]|uniref:Uncharacterized protein n=1 Tax=Eumeta variegata TaxID=151549 RepID=A0A4C1VRN2_EUMVA|nr:hypothetical protein EVAR_88900_1 [Eumeta japonica]
MTRVPGRESIESVLDEQRIIRIGAAFGPERIKAEARARILKFIRFCSGNGRASAPVSTVNASNSAFHLCLLVCRCAPSHRVKCKRRATSHHRAGNLTVTTTGTATDNSRNAAIRLQCRAEVLCASSSCPRHLVLRSGSVLASPASPDPQVVVFDPDMDDEYTTLSKEPKKRSAATCPSKSSTSDSNSDPGSSDVSDHSDFTTVRRRKASKLKPEASCFTQASDGSTYYRITPSSKKPKKFNIAKATIPTKSTRSIYDAPENWKKSFQPTTVSQGAVDAGETKAAAPAAAKNNKSDEADVTAPPAPARATQSRLRCLFRTRIGGPSCAKDVRIKISSSWKRVNPFRD